MPASPGRGRETGFRDMPDRGPNNELPASASDTDEVTSSIAGRGSVVEMFIGWDWASATHDVTVMDDSGARVARWALPHTEDGLTATLARLAGYGAPAQLPVAIEARSGLVVDRLLTAGHPVVPVHPNGFHAARPRWGAARAKTDAGDSFKLADYLRTDGHHLPVLAPTSAPTLDLQALCRTRTDHVEAKVAATNQLAALLGVHWPGAAAVFARLDSAIALDFLDRYPTPASAQRLTAARIAAFCRRHGYCGRRTPEELLTRLRTAPASASRLHPDVVAELVTAQARLLRTLLGTIDELDHVIAVALDEHPWAASLATLPRIGTINLAQIVGEVGPILQRADSCEQLAAETGMAPVTYESGKVRTVSFRVAVNHHARQAMATFADNSRHASPWAAHVYAAARGRGKRHPHAVRILARAWLRVIWACYRSATPYDPASHRAAHLAAADPSAA